MDMEFIDNMIAKKEFFFERVFDIEVNKRDEPTYICLRLRLDNNRGKVVPKDYPTSGFPRRFLVEKERNASRMQKRKAEIERRRTIRRTTSRSEGETNSTTSSNRGRKSAFASLGRSSSVAVQSEAQSPPSIYNSLSDTEYQSEDEAEREMERLRKLDLGSFDEGKEGLA